MNIVNFRPWRRDYTTAILFSTTAILSGNAAILIERPAIGIFLSSWLAIRGHQRIKRGLLRERGIEIEHTAIARLKQEIDGLGYNIQSNIQLDRGGNIDLIIAPPWTGAQYVVEIKSYKGIVQRSGYISKYKSLFPLSRPLRQVRGQCRNVTGGEFFPVIWLVESSLDQHFVFQNVLIVNGGIHRLLTALNEFDQVVPRHAMVQFNMMPQVEYRDLLKNACFRYDGSRWFGTLSKHRFAQIKMAFEMLDQRFGSFAPGRISSPDL